MLRIFKGNFNRKVNYSDGKMYFPGYYTMFGGSPAAG
jgi:hypothetical protein